MERRTRQDLGGAVQLVVQGDDLGMCHAVNLGVLDAYGEGILTQTTAMAPCPWWPEGIAMAMGAGLAVGMHATLTCDWDNLCWRPLTSGSSLVTGDRGTFPATVDEARLGIDTDEATEEIRAQHGMFGRAGCPPTHMDYHMGPVCLPAYETVCHEKRTPFLYPAVHPHLQVGAPEMLSVQPAKLEWLVSYLAHLAPGVHVLISHPAVDHPELAAMAGPGHPSRPWADEHRLSDLRCLCAPEVKQVVDQRDIQLISFGDVAVVG